MIDEANSDSSAAEETAPTEPITTTLIDEDWERRFRRLSLQRHPLPMLWLTLSFPPGHGSSPCLSVSCFQWPR